MPDTGRRLALLVATSHYSDPDLRELRAPGRDAAELSEVLRDPRIGGFEIRMLVNAPSGEVQEGIEDFCTDRHPDDQLMIYLSCHGVLDSNGRLYYTAANTRRQRLAATAIAATWLNERLQDSRARRQILVLDCCHSGAFARGAKGDQELALQQRFEPHGRGRVVLTASRSTEYSFEGGQASGEGVPSVFTHAIVNGLRTGDADRDKDGLITVTDLYQYVYDNVRAAEPRQTPELWTYGAEGNLLVAHSIRGAVIEPEPLPEDLRITLQSPRRRVRETGVAELAELLDTASPGVALAARQALERIAEEDHPQVAALARIAASAPKGAAADQVHRELTDRAHREQHARQEAQEQTRRQAQERILSPAGTQTPSRPKIGRRQSDREQVPTAHPKTPVQPPESRAQAATTQPKLELSTLAVDFGHIQVGSKPKSRRITVIRGSNLNMRIVSTPEWIQAELIGGTLILKAEPRAPGSLIGDVVIHSDGGPATIRIAATIDSPNVPSARHSPSVPPERGYYQGDKLATWWQRVKAALIDLLVLIPGIVLAIVSGQSSTPQSSTPQSPVLWTPGIPIGILISVAIWLYNRSYLEGRTGQSWGKKAIGLKLIRISGRGSISPATAFVRELVNCVTVFVLGFLFPLWTVRRQTLADKAMKTVVISLKP